MSDLSIKEVEAKIPVTVVTGFLGSGKTTLINRILSDDHGKKIAVIVNEFGEISIDGQLIVQEDNEDLVEFNNGCLCCTVRGDLVETINRLINKDKLDAILIETTGLADPAPVASTFFVADEIKDIARLDSFVTLVDSINLETNLTQSHEAQEQVAFADIILINKTDLVSKDDLKSIEKRVRLLNPMAKIHYTEHSKIDFDKVFGVGAFDLDSKLEVDPTFLDDLDHEHDDDVGSFVITEKKPIDINKFMLWITPILMERGDEIYRSKGIFNARGSKEKIVFQSVRMLTAMRKESSWSSEDERETQYVVIGKNLDKSEFTEGLKKCIAS